MSNTILFNGTSRFSADFQSVIDRSVAIASLPIDQLNAQKTTFTSQSTALSAIDSKLAAVQSALQSVQTAVTSGSLNTSVSDGSIAKVTTGGGALPGSYTLEVTGLGSFSNTISNDGLLTVTDPARQNISPPGAQFAITINGTTITVAAASNTLNGLVNAINAQPGLNVQATIVNVGSTTNPDYRLSVQSTRLGPVSVQVNDGTRDVLNTLTTGSLATYKVNGLSTSITSDSRTITLAPGLTANLLAQSSPGVAAAITVTQDSSAIGNALSSLAKAYNAAIDELDKNRGVNKGALAGQSLVYTLAQALRQSADYGSGGAGINSLTSLGLTFLSSGRLSFDQTAFSAATSHQVTALTDFLGNTTTGGFLKHANDVLTGLEDSSHGVVKSALLSIQQQISNDVTLISTNQDRVDKLKQSLQAKLNAADALIAALEQQVTYITALFQAMQPTKL